MNRSKYPTNTPYTDNTAGDSINTIKHSHYTANGPGITAVGMALFVQNFRSDVVGGATNSPVGKEIY